MHSLHMGLCSATSIASLFFLYFMHEVTKRCSTPTFSCHLRHKRPVCPQVIVCISIIQVQQGLEICGFWFQKKTVYQNFWIFGQRKTVLSNFCLQGTKCCNYGADGKKIVTAQGGYNCILVPGASLAGAIKQNKICGNNMGIITAGGETSATLCCKFVIEQISFYSLIRDKFFILPIVIIHKLPSEVSQNRARHN